MNEKKINNLTGWGVFGIALIVYLLTVAPTSSFWDCGEFIACANELEVTHPPGAPLFLLLGRIFAMLAFNQVENIAFSVNLMSVFSGAFTAMLTCWITTMLVSRGLRDHEWDERTRILITQAAGVVAGLCCIFADSIWWNAVEAEVYAMSSLFTALVVWLIFKWSARADEPDNLKWIILIAYVMGLSTGVHLLNLLTIPALALVYYYRKFDFTWKGFLATMGLSVVALAVIQYGIIQYTFSLAWEFERFFTGTVTRAGANPTGMGWPMGSGLVIFGLLFLGLIVGLLVYSQRTQNIVLNTVVLCYTVILIGFSSYSLIFIRSSVDPPIDMNNPENILTFLSYMKREQYGDRPLLRGPLYSSEIERDSRGYALYDVVGKKYTLLEGQDRYVEDTENREYLYKDKVWFPRMYESTRPQSYSSQFGYMHYVRRKGQDKERGYDDKPKKSEDWKFFFDYQLNHMYIRYFMWNFVGRSSDIQDDGWESGILDASETDNKANNHYYFLPLFLGLLGIVWQLINKKRDAGVIGMLFFFTGIAIIIYLNQYPAQPRERDYSFAGSFQTFCIWIGMGVCFLADLLRKNLGKNSAYVAGGICLLAPLLMGFQNWDDHTRKGRYVDREFAYNLLASCAPNAILFTGGDNDTFPLWYIQEVEGVRTDVRIVNLELLISDWYIDQMKQPKNQSAALPIHMKREDYAGEQGLMVANYPSKTIRIPIDKEALIAQGMLSEQEASWAADTMEWNFRARGSSRNPYILRKDSVMIELITNIAADNWKRPVYFASMMAPSSFVGLEAFFRLEGLAYRVVPVKRTEGVTPNDVYHGWVGQDIMYRNLMDSLKFTRLDDPRVYFDEHARRVIIQASYRNAFYRLGYTLGDQIQQLREENKAINLLLSEAEEGDTLQSALNRNQALIQEKQQMVTHLIDRLTTAMPEVAIAYEFQDYNSLLQIYESSGLVEEALSIAYTLRDRAVAELERVKRVYGRIPNNEYALSAAVISVRVFLRLGKREEAEALAQKVQELTGIEAQRLLNVR